MTNYIAKLERKATVWGGKVKIKTEYAGVRANSDEEAKAEFESILRENEVILFFCKESEASAEDLEAYHNES